MHRVLAICVLLASATDEAHGHFALHWLTRSQLPALQQPTVAVADHNDGLPVSTMNTAWSNLGNVTDTSVMYFVETKQELFLFNVAPPTPITTPGKTDNSVPRVTTGLPATSTSANTRVPAASTSASTRVPAFSTSTPTTSIYSEPAISTTPPTTSTSAQTSGSRAYTTSSNAYAASSNAYAASSNAYAASSSASTTSTVTPLSSSSIPPGYTYYSETGSYYKLHQDNVKSWYEANATCASEGAYLTVLNDAEEAAIVKSIEWDRFGTGYGLWLGLRDIQPGGVSDWRTVHGVPLSEVFHDWFVDRPYNEPGENCGVFSSSTGAQLFDRPCIDYLKWYIICEISQ